MVKYGITVEEYELSANQSGRTMRHMPTDSERRLHVDHNHATGEVRGLLCRNCNSAIGKLGDNFVTVLAAAGC